MQTSLQTCERRKLSMPPRPRLPSPKRPACSRSTQASPQPDRTLRRASSWPLSSPWPICCGEPLPATSAEGVRLRQSSPGRFTSPSLGRPPLVLLRARPAWLAAGPAGALLTGWRRGRVNLRVREEGTTHTLKVTDAQLCRRLMHREVAEGLTRDGARVGDGARLRLGSGRGLGEAGVRFIAQAA